MATTIQEERWRWVKPIISKELKIIEVSKVCPHSIRSLKRWKRAYEEEGMEGLVPKSTKPKTQPNETPIRTKEEVIALRRETGLCARKLNWRLKKRGVIVPVSTIGKILKEEGLVRKYRKKKVKYTYLKAQRKPGELVEIDVKYVPGRIAGKRYYQYTAIDSASRWRHLEVFDEQASCHTITFLKIVMKKFPHQIKAIKTDNHAIFTNYYLGTNKRSDMTVKSLHPLDQFCADSDINHYLIDPGKPAQNGTVERSHREDQEKFYDRYPFTSLLSLKRKIRTWNDYYNNLEHCSLDGRTPLEMLELSDVPNVLS
jgi:transposase InsO family protein